MKKFTFIFVFFILANTFQLIADSPYFGPYLQRPTLDGISVLWETEKPVVGKVVFGLSADALSDTLEEDSATTFHNFRLQGLTANTVYYYRCIWNGKSTDTFHFKTAPADDSTPIRICVLGDSRSNPDIFKRICEQIKSYNPDIIFHSGDLVAAGDHIEQWKPQFFDPAKDLINHIPIYTALGNHERRSGYYYQHFTVHNGMPYWSADYGSVHILGLNSVEDGSPNSEQYKWLEEDLKSSQDRPWRIAIFHHPLYHAQPYRPIYDIRYYWTPLFIKYNLQLVAAGHDHYYLRTYPIGKRGEREKAFIQVISAGGGAPLYDFEKTKFTDVVVSKHHFLILDVTKDKITARAISIDGKVLDEFEYERGKPFPDEPFIEWSAVSLEARVKKALASVEPNRFQDGKYIFETNVVIPTEFDFPTVGYYQWKNSEGWQFSPSGKIMFQLKPSQALVLPINASVTLKKADQSPELVMHIQSDTSAGVNIDFSNQDIRIPFEDAQFIRVERADKEKVDDVLQFMEMFSNGKHFGEAVRKLSTLIFQNRSDTNLEPVDGFLQKHPQAKYRYQLYPLYFINDDYSHFLEWAKLAEEFAPNKIELPRTMVARFVFRKQFPGKAISDWEVAGLLPYMEIKDENESLSDIKSLISEKGLKWQKASASKSGLLNFIDTFGEKRHVTSFARTVVTANQDGQAILFFGSDDGAIIWVNGKKVFSYPGKRNARACDDIIPVSLKKGNNEIFIQLNQIDVNWGLYLQIGDPMNIL